MTPAKYSVEVRRKAALKMLKSNVKRKFGFRLGSLYIPEKIALLRSLGVIKVAPSDEVRFDTDENFRQKHVKKSLLAYKDMCANYRAEQHLQIMRVRPTTLP